MAYTTRLTAGPQYVVLDSVAMANFTVELGGDFKNNLETVTAGNVGHEQVVGGLNAYSFKLKAVYETDSVSTYIQKLKPGSIFSLEWGPEGNTAGKPRHVQDVAIESVSMTQTADKKAIMFEASARGSTAPSYDMFAGATY